jgi:putative chitinase
MLIDLEKLNTMLPKVILDELKQVLLKRTLSKFQLAHLLSQCHHESNGWKVFEENLNYSAQRLLIIFKKRVGSLEKAQEIVRGGQKSIGDFVYGSRMGNNSDEGYTYRGRGSIQLTGKNNYKLFDATVLDDIVKNPDLVKDKYKLTSAFWFFDANKIWLLCGGDKVEDVKKVTLAINGGQTGLDERIKLFRQYCTLL